MSDTQLRASVVVAVYNEAENVAAVCNEILEGMAPAAPFEVVWVDDGSSDDTANILQGIADRDPRVRARDGCEPLRQLGAGDDGADPAAVDPVP
jgi:glycosyltransferase involved in cell wall biosynthesis